MPTLLTQIPEFSPPPVPPRKRWTRDQFTALEASGLFQTERLELIDGELINKMGKNRAHVNALTLMLIWLQSAFGNQFVNSEAPIDVSLVDNATNEPEPDLLVLARETATFVSGNPQPPDNSGPGVQNCFYREVKPEGAIGDFNEKANGLYCHRDLLEEQYRSVMIYGENEFLSPLLAPDCFFNPVQAFGP